MQDRFKYRAWNKINKTMKEVTQITLDKKQTASMSDITEKITVHLLYQPHFVLMQCTGLKDVNGKLIYEGDIVKLFNDEFCNIHTVKFGDFAMYSLDFQTGYEKGSAAVYGWYLGGLTYPIPLSISLDTSGLELEVIGNIYENPELIGGAE